MRSRLRGRRAGVSGGDPPTLSAEEREALVSWEKEHRAALEQRVTELGEYRDDVSEELAKHITRAEKLANDPLGLWVSTHCIGWRRMPRAERLAAFRAWRARGEPSIFDESERPFIVGVPQGAVDAAVRTEAFRYAVQAIAALERSRRRNEAPDPIDECSAGCALVGVHWVEVGTPHPTKTGFDEPAYAWAAEVWKVLRTHKHEIARAAQALAEDDGRRNARGRPSPEPRMVAIAVIARLLDMSDSAVRDALRPPR